MSTKKLGRVMWIQPGDLEDESMNPVLLGRTAITGKQKDVPLLCIPLTDPAALVEAIEKVIAEEYLKTGAKCGFCDDDIATAVARRALGVPAKLLKERKK